MIYGFAGPAGCGKDTCAEYLRYYHGYERVSYAMPLKAALATMGFPEPASQAAKEVVIPWLGKSYRQLAQTLGTEWGRVCVHPDIWTKLLFRSLDPGKNYVISDVRFENEAAQLRAAGGRIVHVRNRRYPMPPNTASHASEVPLTVQPGDILLDNGVASLERLYSSLDTILKETYVESRVHGAD